MNLIELHVLQSFPVTCLNRDDVGAPKSAIFGGAMRARVSSQCWKRAIREAAQEACGQHFAGKRGHYFAGLLAERLVRLEVAPDPALKGAEEIVTFLGQKDAKSKEAHKSSVALYLSPGELDAIATAAAGDFKESGQINIKKGSVRNAIKEAGPKDAADIAFFGRMVASDHTLSLEGAGLFSHALSTHAVHGDIDFFSAVDDLKPEDSEGAGHIGTLEFNSACYYRYVGLNVDLLFDTDHLGHLERKERLSVLDGFIRSCLLAVPKARHNSMFGHNPPGYVLGLVRKGQPLSLVNAFEKPIRSQGGLLEPSIKALREHHDKLRNTWGIGGEAHVIPDLTLDQFCQKVVSHVG